MASFRRLILLWLRAFALTATIVGPICVFAALGFGGYREWFSLHSREAQGTVLTLERRADKRGEFFYPHFSFKSSDGHQHEVVSSAAAAQDTFRPGQQVPVVYRIDNPDSAYIDTAGERWNLIMLLGGAGAVLTYAGLWAKQKTTAPGYGNGRVATTQ